MQHHKNTVQAGFEAVDQGESLSLTESQEVTENAAEAAAPPAEGREEPPAVKVRETAKRKTDYKQEISPGGGCRAGDGAQEEAGSVS